jgi:hypothetical protein
MGGDGPAERDVGRTLIDFLADAGDGASHHVP